jgi:O-antigen ligase
VELAFSDGILGGMQHILNLVAIFGLLTYFARIVSARDVWYWSAMVGGVVSGLGSLIFFLQQGALPEFNENAWSLFPLTSLFTACVYFARPAPWINPRLLVMLAFVNALWVFLSGSRGSMAICAVCLAFIVVQLRYAPGRLALIVIGAFAVMGIANQFKDLGTYAAGRVLKLFDSERSMSNKTSGRWDIAEEGWRIFVRNPFGIGTGGFGKAYAALEQPQRVSSFRQGREIQAHSGWIKVLVENGVPGILCFGGFVFSFAARGWMRRSAGMLLPGLLVTLALSVAFVADEFQCKGLWYLSGAVILFFRRCHGRASSLVRSTSGLRREGLRNGAMALENRQARR